MQTQTVFLDAGGVLIDSSVMAEPWQRAVAEHFAPKLGGTAEQWRAANIIAHVRWTARVNEAARKAGPRKGSRDAHLAARTAWLVDMCEQVGVAAPEDVDAAAEEGIRVCARRAVVPFGDAVAGVRSLREGGYRLFTSSGEPSWEIASYLEGMGIREPFEQTYGCDLLDRWKTGPHYYRAICEDAGIDPRRAVAVDDNAVVLDWAAKLRMRTFLVGGQGGGQRHERIASLLELAPLI